MGWNELRNVSRNVRAVEWWTVWGSLWSDPQLNGKDCRRWFLVSSERYAYLEITIFTWESNSIRKETVSRVCLVFNGIALNKEFWVQTIRL